MPNTNITDEIIEKVALHFYPALKFPIPPANLKLVYDDVRSFLETIWPEPATEAEVERLRHTLHRVAEMARGHERYEYIVEIANEVLSSPAGGDSE